VNITLGQYVQLRQKQYRFHCKLLMRGDLDPNERECILHTIAMGPLRPEGQDPRLHWTLREQSIHTFTCEVLHKWRMDPNWRPTPPTEEELMKIIRDSRFKFSIDEMRFDRCSLSCCRPTIFDSY